MELRKLFPILTGIVIVLLAAITALGIKQYLLYRHCDAMLTHSNRIIYQFTSIKEHINDSLVAGTTINIPETSRELLSFDQDLKDIVDDILIPEEFKLSLVSQVDLMSLVVQLRTIMGKTSAPSSEQAAKLTASLRSINNRLLAFHNVLAGHTRSLLLGLYKVIVGTLALIIFFTTTMLLLINRFIAVPIVRLCSLADHTTGSNKRNSWKTSTLPASIQSLTEVVIKGNANKKRMEDLRICLEDTLQTLPESFDSPDNWETLCAALQTNPNYFLVWVGQHTDKKRFPDHIIGNGCISSSPAGCRQAIEHLIEFRHQDGELCDTATKAMQRGTHVVAETPFDRIPQTLQHSLMLDEQPVQSASFPITGPTRNVDTVITIYSSKTEGFNALEISVLQLLFTHISHRRCRPTTTSSCDTIPTDLYCFAVAGELSTSLAHEMINISNGALNYSQALIDLTADDRKKDEGYFLLEKLHNEQQKISSLAADFNRLVGVNASAPRRITFEQVLQPIRNLLKGRFRQQNITLQAVVDNNIPEIIVPVPLLQVVLLSLLHEAEVYIHSLTEPAGEGRVYLRAALSSAPTPKLHITISPLRTDIETYVPADTGPWPPITVCYDIIHSFQGELLFNTHASEPYLAATLVLPLQIETST